MDAALRSTSHPFVFAAGDVAHVEPQERFLSLVSTGDRYAVGSWAGLSFEGRWVWWLRDWIDRRWMARFSERGG